MHERTIIFWSTCVGCLLGAASAPLYVLSGDTSDVMYSLPPFTMGLFGALIVLRHAGNRVGKVMWLSGVLLSIASFGNAYAMYSASQSSLPGERLGWWIANWAFTGGYLIAIAGVFLFFPTGAPPSPRWRTWTWFAVGSLSFFVFTTATSPDPITPEIGAAFANPVALDLGFIPLGGIITGITVLTSLAICLASLVTRARHSNGVERQQIKWLLWSATAVLALFVPAEMLVDHINGFRPVHAVLTLTAYFALIVGIPASIAIAVLRHNLFNIDRLINRSVVYLLLTIALTAGYLASIVVFGGSIRAATGGDSSVAIMLSTLIVAALFRPLRSRIQGLVDQRFYRRKYDAERILDSFGERLRDEVDLHTLSLELDAVVRHTVQPADVSIWIRADSFAGGQTRS